MNKAIAKELNEIADSLPLVFKWIDIQEEFTGKELNLTPLGEIMPYDNDSVYVVMMPALEATEHKQQLKDAYCKGGWPAVHNYKMKVLQTIQGENCKRLN